MCAKKERLKGKPNNKKNKKNTRSPEKWQLTRITWRQHRSDSAKHAAIHSLRSLRWLWMTSPSESSPPRRPDTLNAFGGFLFVFLFFKPASLSLAWVCACETMLMKLESNERGCWSCRQARFVRRSARLLCRCHPAARSLLLCLHLALWYRAVGARRLSKHRGFSALSLCYMC